ncbi:NTP pyrophosphatase [Globomyces pollinis-pini]|nr:NTP pyrophosphatase [Globomyces pollinis-pini]
MFCNFPSIRNLVKPKKILGLMKMNYFAGNPLDRQSFKRANKDLLSKERSANSKTILFHNLNYLANLSNKQINWLTPRQTTFLDLDKIPSVYLGWDNKSSVSYWAMDVSTLPLETFKEFGPFLECRRNATQLTESEAAILAQARSMLDWNQRYYYCSGCGSKTESQDVGYKRQCVNEKCVSQNSTQNYAHPRTDAVVISVVISPCGNKILLGRKPNWGATTYSCLAGFVEPGESLEEAVRREVYEEAGVVVSNVTYHSSQPWPFPSNLMFGCISQATTTDIKFFDDELEDAKWFDYQTVQSALKGESKVLSLPSSVAIAYTLITHWVSTFKNNNKL